MKPRREIEIKLRVTNPRKLKQLLKRLGFRRSTPRLLERNSLFDFPNGKLARAGTALRLRATGGRNILTFKGTVSRSNGYKSRWEIETDIDNPQELRRILSQLQLREVFRYSKHRTTYAPPGKTRNSSVLVYDETPVGNFIELEGPPVWIDRVATQLGYSRDDYMTAGYVSLYRAAHATGCKGKASRFVPPENS